MKPFDNYEIHGCAEHNAGTPEAFTEQCPDSEAEYWTLFGHIPGQGLETIRDFPSREAAEEMFRRITGIAFGSHEEIKARLRVMHAGTQMLAALRLASERLGTLIDADEDTENDCRAYDAVCDAIVEATKGAA